MNHRSPRSRLNWFLHGWLLERPELALRWLADRIEYWNHRTARSIWEATVRTGEDV